MSEVKTGKQLKFDSYKVAHDLPELPMVTWTYHDKPTTKDKFWDSGLPHTLRTTSVSILTPDGNVFTGISACSELDTFSKKDGFQRAYGRARQKYVQYVRDGSVKPDFVVKDMEANIQDIGRWIGHHAMEMKIDFLKTVYSKRIKKGIAFPLETVS